MNSGDARHSRRDNGLIAAEYGAAGDVDPRVGEHLLDVLALEGIAAYLRPSTDLNPVTRQTSLPARPTDRLYVDRSHLATARTYLARLSDESGGVAAGGSGGSDSTGSGGPAGSGDRSSTGSGGPGGGSRASSSGPSRGAGASGERPGSGARGEPVDDVDAEWAKIVAGFDDDVEAAQRSWPAQEELADGAADTTRAERDDDPGAIAGTTNRVSFRGGRTSPPADAAEPSLLDGLDTFGADLPDEDEEGYTPPAPPPVPRPSMPTVLGIAGMAGGLLIFLQPTLLPISEGTAVILGFLAIMSGFATLVWRLRPGDDDDPPDPDDGARV